MTTVTKLFLTQGDAIKAAAPFGGAVSYRGPDLGDWLVTYDQRPNAWALEPGKHRDYATRKRLEDAIEFYGFSQIRHMIVQQSDQRWTAIFTGPDANPVIFAGFAWFA